MTSPTSDIAALLDGSYGLIRAGRLDEARDLLLRAVELAPGDPVPLQRLANVTARQGDWGASRVWLEKLIALRPGNAATQARLGLVCHFQGKLRDAASAYEEALALDPQQADALAGLGRIAIVHGSAQDAQVLFERTLAAQPGHPDATAGLAGLHENRGDAAEALALLEPLIAQGVTNAELVRIFAGASRQLNDPQPAVRLVRELLQRQLPQAERSALLFTLAGLHDSAGLWKEAFQAADEANRLLPEAFAPEKFRRRVDRLLEAFAEGPSTEAAASQSNAPMVFIVGVPRSGTTLVEQILGQHSSVHAVGEHSRLESMAVRLQQSAGRPWELALDDCTPDQLEAMADRYLAPLDEIPDSAAVVTDKMPVNFLYLGLAARVFPRAKVIWCRRDPLDVGLSCFMQAFGGRGVEFASDLAHIGRYIRQSDRLMEHWRDVLELPVYELQYEKMVQDPQTSVAQLLEFLGLEWDDQCLRFHESRRFVDSPSYAQVRKPINSKGVGRYRHYEQFLEPLKEALASASEAD